MEEFWKNIPGYEGLYQVSTKGRVRGLDRVRDHGVKDIKRFSKGRLLKGAINTNGYVQLSLSKNGKVKKYMVHKLMQYAFACLFPVELGKWIDHEDRNRSNNNIENLRCCDNSRNLMNAKKRNTGKETSIFKGVYYDKNRKKWSSRVQKNNKKVFFKRYDTELEAAIAYNENALKHFGEYANLNMIGV